MEKEVIRITFADTKISLLDSKIGGSFIWESDNPPGIFLAQINLSDLIHVKDLPSNGWLQFFVEKDPDFGLSMDKGSVIYRPVLKGSEIRSDYEITPILKEARMRFSYDKEDVSCSDYRFDKEETEDMYDKYSGAGSKIFGYPDFCQWDPRKVTEKNRKYDTLLLQLDSDFDHIMWGDSGIGNFFINSKDLKNKDFSDILFNWDCC